MKKSKRSHQVEVRYISEDETVEVWLTDKGYKILDQVGRELMSLPGHFDPSQSYIALLCLQMGLRIGRQEGADSVRGGIVKGFEQWVNQQ